MSQLTPQQMRRMSASRLSNVITPSLIFLAGLAPSVLLVLLIIVAAAIASARWPAIGLPLYGLLLVLSLLLALRTRWHAETYFPT